MKYFGSIFKFEWKRFTERRKLWIVVVFAFISLYFVQTGVNQYYSILKNNAEVARQERVMAEQFTRYETYASLGVRMRLTPPPTSVFFDNNGMFNEVSGRINGLHILDIKIPLKGKQAFQKRKWYFANFSGWFLFMATLLVLFYGTETFNNIDFDKSIASLIGHNKVFLFRVLARLLNIVIASAFVWIFSVLVASVNGVSLTGTEYWHITISFFVWLKTGFFFFMLGMLVGLILLKKSRVVLLLVLWVLLIFLFPMIFDFYSSYKSRVMQSNISMDEEKLTIFKNLEAEGRKKFVEFKKEKRFREDVREFVKEALENQYRHIEQMERKLQRRVQRHIKKQQLLLMFSPSTFMSTVGSELSGKGMLSISDFNRYMIDFKKGFNHFFINKKYYSPDYNVKGKKLKSYVTGTENIYEASGLLPGFFWIGFTMTGFYCLSLFFFSYRRFLKLLYELKKADSEKWLDFNAEVKAGDYKVLRFSHSRAVDLFYTIFSGQYSRVQPGLISANFKTDGKEILPIDIDYSGKFLYICTPEDLPGDATVKDLIDLFSNFLELKADDRAKLFERVAEAGSTDRSIRKLKKREKCLLLLDISSFNNKELLFYSDLTNNTPRYIKGRFLSIIRMCAAKGTAVFGLWEDLNYNKNTSEDIIVIFEYPKWDELLEVELEANGIVVKQED